MRRAAAYGVKMLKSRQVQKALVDLDIPSQLRKKRSEQCGSSTISGNRQCPKRAFPCFGSSGIKTEFKTESRARCCDPGPGGTGASDPNSYGDHLLSMQESWARRLTAEVGLHDVLSDDGLVATIMEQIEMPAPTMPGWSDVEG